MASMGYYMYDGKKTAIVEIIYVSAVNKQNCNATVKKYQRTTHSSLAQNNNDKHDMITVSP